MVDSSWNTERILRLVSLAILVIACGQVVFPFVGALTWAAIIAVTVWPAFLWLTARLGDRPVVAASLCVVVLNVLLVLPFAALASTLGQAVPQLAQLLQDLAGSQLPPPPAWLVEVPAVGPILRDIWQAAATDIGSTVQRLVPGAERAGVWVLDQGFGIAVAVLEFFFAILISGVFLITADRSTDIVQRIVARLNISGGGALLDTIVTTVRSVSIGLVGTSAVQALIAAAGFVIFDVPAAAVLGFLTFFLSLVQLPTLLVWIPAAIWLYLSGPAAPAIGLTLWGFILVNPVDNFLRPWLISRGAKLPFALIFIGVIGGLLAWGMIGLFIGPTLLAIAYSLVRQWVGKTAAVGSPKSS
jgi:predicted PurR-regulated permease PerM